MITVHLIFNAHLDPVWLWPWQAGLDAALATCHSACDRLDAHPDLMFSRGEAWVYREIEQTDPALFARIRGHWKAGRWEIVNGWWIQPDCNLPSRAGIEEQIARGRAYFEDTFGPGAFPRVAYNVDSFGHAAALPSILRANKQDRYVFMRPQEHEMALPSRLFRWREKEGGPEVTAFRVARAYTTRQISRAHIEASLTELPPGVQNTMCFVGVGDHGGGPTEEQIAWLREHTNDFPGCRLLFSTPSRFFDAVEPHLAALPLVTGELQQHAVGCYSVHRAIKTAVRRAEHLLETADAALPDASNDRSGRDAAWERVCFAQFHDTLGGTCLPSAYEQILNQVGGATAWADEALHRRLRVLLNDLPPDSRQRIVLWNPSATPFSGYVEHEPWLEWQAWQPNFHLVDDTGTAVPYQTLHSEAATNGLTRLLFRADIPAGTVRAFFIERDAPASDAPALPPVPVIGDHWVLSTGRGRITLSSDGVMFGIGALALPELHLLPDDSDTWSHGLSRFADVPPETPRWNAPVLVDSGPLMASRRQTGSIGQSRLGAEWRVYADEVFVELLLSVHWCETGKLLKLVLPLRDALPERRDATMGDFTPRLNDGRELPVSGWVCVPTNYRGASVGLVCPDVFALDADTRRVRLTLLRSPLLAYHDPYPAALHPRPVIADQGVHTFRFRLLYGPEVTPNTLGIHAGQMQRPPLAADLTRGMTV